VIYLRHQFRAGGVTPRLAIATFAVLVFLGLTPLAGAQEGTSNAAEAPEDGQSVGTDYLVGKEDILKVTVFGEESLSVETMPVRPDGKISLPLLGDIVAAGKSPEGLADELTEMYKDHVLAPEVTVMVVAINSFKVYILGNVQNPGEQTFGRQTTLLQALAMAGGFSDFANTKRIVVIREEAAGPRRMVVNYEKIISGQNLEMNLKLKPGDTIVVP
jgi:polysaccharide export outer membrane protein